MLAALLCGAVEVQPGQAGEIYLGRARVTGKLNVPGATFNHRLRLHGCYVADGIDLTEATTRMLDLRGCRAGAIRLDRAKINGAFILRGARLDGKDGPALTAQGLTVTADMVCDGGFQADGEVKLSGASIGSQLNLTGARLNGKNGPALTAQGLTVTADMVCDGGFQADGEVNLAGAKIGGVLVGLGFSSGETPVILVPACGFSLPTCGFPLGGRETAPEGVNLALRGRISGCGHAEVPPSAGCGPGTPTCPE